MARVLWYGDAGAPTGFARVTHALANRLVDRGHDISVLALEYSGDWSPETERLKLYRAAARSTEDRYGGRRIAEVIEKVDPEAIVFLHDPKLLMQLLFANPMDPGHVFGSTAPIISYLPVDGYDYPELWRTMIPLRTNVVAMSRHGQATFPGSKLVYHGVDTDQFWPVSPSRPIEMGGLLLESKTDCKVHLDLNPESFLILRVDANSGRKDYSSLIAAVAPLMETHRDIHLWLHANTDPKNPGVDIPTMLNRFDVGEQYTLTDPNAAPWTTEQLNVLYNAADVFVSTSRGEGFGLTLAEAAATGCPVIAQNVSAIPEVVGSGGLLLGPQRRLTTPGGWDTWVCDVDAFHEAVRELYFDPDKRERLGQQGAAHVLSSFSWDFATDRFNDFIEHAARWRGSMEARDESAGTAQDAGD